ncbi:MAG: zinc ribbon domain-containing protein [Methanoregula sp.]|nr:MAG: zinc ribbon domain-containing protein [Methanoregula sp.]
MGAPDLHGDESVILKTPDVFVKSIPFEAVLTNKRIILIDRENDLVPPKDILLATIRDVQPGENAIRDLTLSLAIIATTGETRKIVLTFSGKSGAKRKRERDEWVRALQKHTRSSLKKVFSTVIPGLNPEKKAKFPDTAPVRSGSPSLPLEKKSVDAVEPQKKIGQSAPAIPSPLKPAPLPAPLFCSRCGSRAPAGSLFCVRCGAKIVVPEQEPPSTYANTGTRPSPQPARALQAKKERWQVLPQLFRRKDRLPEPGPGVPPSKGGRPGGSNKKAFMIIAVIAILIIVIGGVVFAIINFLNNTPAADGGTTGTGTKIATPTPTFVFVEKTAAPIPAKGVWVRVSYIGMWTGSYGTADALKSVTGSGEYLYEVENPNTTIQATFQRADTSSRPHELVVGIYKNGVLIKQGVTTVPHGTVDITVDPNTAKPTSAQTTGK